MKSIKKLLVRLGHWLIRVGSEAPVVVPPVAPAIDPMRELAKVLTARQNEKWPERDGECKRAAVYGQMVNSYPDRRKRDISRAIEDAL